MEEAAIGVDIGATYTKYGIMTKSGKLLASGKILTAKASNFHDFLDEIASALSDCKKGLSVAGIGVGAPNGNSLTGCIEHAANLPWKGILPLVQELEKRLHANVTMTNDANAAAVGEMLYGRARGLKHFAVITIGTGLGGGIVANGRLLIGGSGLAGELGHINAKENGRICGCGQRGCLETYVSAPGLALTAAELLAKGEKPSVLDKIPPETMTSEDIHRAALEGDETAAEAFRITGKILGIKLADLIKLLAPEAIFLAGGVAGAGDLLLRPAAKYAETCLPQAFKGRTRLLLSGLQSSITGPCSLVWYDF